MVKYIAKNIKIREKIPGRYPHGFYFFFTWFYTLEWLYTIDQGAWKKVGYDISICNYYKKYKIFVRPKLGNCSFRSISTEYKGTCLYTWVVVEALRLNCDDFSFKTCSVLNIPPQSRRYQTWFQVLLFIFGYEKIPQGHHHTDIIEF